MNLPSEFKNLFFNRNSTLKLNKKIPGIISRDFQRRRRDLNSCIRVLQTHALPLGYCAIALSDRSLVAYVQ